MSVDNDRYDRYYSLCIVKIYGDQAEIAALRMAATTVRPAPAAARSMIPTSETEMDFSAETEARIIAMYQKGTSTNQIGRLLGFHKSYAVKVLDKHRIPLRYRRITLSEAATMAEMYARCIPGPEISTHFQTTPTAVYAALERLGIERRPSHNGFIGECDHDFFNIINTEPKAYFLAAMGGDGCVSQADEIIFDLKDIDIGLVEAFRSALKIGNLVRILETEKLFNGYRFRYRHARVSVNSPFLARALAKYGVIPVKTGRMIPARVPEQVPARLERHYWRGWVDTDGWVAPRLTGSKTADGKRRQFEVGLTGDLAVVEAFRDYCERHTPTGASILPNGPIWSFTVTDSYAMQIAYLLYDGATVYLDRKHQAYLEWRALRPDWIP